MYKKLATSPAPRPDVKRKQHKTTLALWQYGVLNRNVLAAQAQRPDVQRQQRKTKEAMMIQDHPGQKVMA